MTSPALLLDIDGGVQSLVGSDIDIFRPKNFGEIQDIYNYFRYDNDQYRAILVDSLTHVESKEGSWYTAPNHSRPQTCVDQIDIEVEY